MHSGLLKTYFSIVFLVFGVVTVDAQPQLVDRIVAVIDEEIVLHSDVMQRLALTAMQRGVDPREMPEAEAEALYKTILENLVQENLLLAKAREDSIEVDEEQIDEAVYGQMSQIRGRLGEETLEAQLRAEGLTAKDLRDQFRQNFESEYLRQQVMSKLGGEVQIFYKDVENFRTRYQDEIPPMVGVSHILIEARPSEERDAIALKKAADLLEQIRKGEDFGELARQFSEDPGSASSGGELGFFSRGQFLPEFEEAAFSLKPGEVSSPVRTDFGHHIIRVDAVSGREIKARHILISVRATEADKAFAYQRALSFYTSIQKGKDFSELAREHSAHKETAELGGHLGIRSLDGLPPAFTETILKMKLGEVSTPVETEFGWHLVRLDNDREVIEEIVRRLKLSELFRNVLGELREKLYVNVRFSKL